MDPTDNNLSPEAPQPQAAPAPMDEAAIYRYRLAAEQAAGSDAQDPEIAAFNQRMAQQNLAEQGIDHKDLRGDEWDAMRPQEAGIGTKIGHAIERGGIGAWNNIVRSAATVSTHIADSLGLENDRQAEVQKFFATPFSQRQVGIGDQPLTISDQKMEEMAGPAQGGLYGVLEGLTEFGVEFAVTGALTGGLGELATAGAELAGAGKLAAGVTKGVQALEASKLGAGALQGAATTLLFSDPYAKRVSNLLAEGPPQITTPMLSWLNTPIKTVAGTLAADSMDSYGQAQFKNVLEGYLLGMPFAVAGAVLGAAKLKIGKGLKEGVIKEPEAQTLLKEAEAQYADAINAGKAKAEDPAAPAQVVDMPTGEKQVVANNVPGPTFATDLEAQNAKAAIDNHFQAVRDARTPLTPEEIGTIRDRIKELGDNPSPETVAGLLEEHGVNAKYLSSPNYAVNVIKAIAESRAGEVATLRAKPTTDAEVFARAKELFPGMKAADLKPALQRLGVSLEDAPAVLTTARAFITTQAREVKKLALLVDHYPGNGALENHLIDAVRSMQEVHAEFVGANASIGRSLRVNQFDSAKLTEGMTSEEGITNTGVQDRVQPKPLTRQEALDTAHLLAMNPTEDVEGMLKVMAAPTMQEAKAAPDAMRPNLIQKALAARVEFILSSPKTQFVNIISSMHRLFQNPAEMAWAGTKDLAKGEGWETMHQAWDLFSGQVMSTMEATRFAYRAFMEGTPILDPGNFIRESSTNLPSQSISSAMDGGIWNAVKTLVPKLPGRLLVTSDEFFNQILYRSKARQDILSDLRSEVEHGIISSDQDLKAIAERRLQAAVDDGYKGIYKPALDYARDSTYKTELSGFPAAFQKFANSSPVGRFFFPFIRTPANIFDYVWQLTPGLNAFNKNMQEALAKGGVAAKQAVARAEFGAGLYAVAAYAAASGKITGGGPADPALAKTWRQFNQPYSFKMDDGTFISYRRGDTFFAPLGIMADFWSASGHLKETDRVSTAAAITAVFTANALNRSYMSNVDTLFEALSAKDGRKVEKLLGTALGSFVPAAVKDVALTQDPYERELQGIWDNVKARTPGWSKSLEPQMNLFGEKVLRPPGFFNELMNPFTVSGTPKDPYVASELDKLGRNIPNLPDTKANGMIDLKDRNYLGVNGKSPLVRWHELMAEKNGDSPNLRDTLTKVIKSPSWKQMTDSNAYGPGGMKYNIVAKLVDTYRNVAWERLLKENPKLRDAITQEMQVAATGLKGEAAARAKVDDMKALGQLLHRNR